MKNSGVLGVIKFPKITLMRNYRVLGGFSSIRVGILSSPWKNYETNTLQIICKNSKNY